ncbi:MAG: acetyl-CoA carboxylase biotin carboxyl carrier protein [Myxococcota bacterium]
MDIDTKQLEELMQLLAKHGFDEIEIERGEERVLLRKGAGPGSHPTIGTMAPQPGAPRPHGATAEDAAAAARAAEDEDPNVTHITSPFVGTFYRAPSPGADPYVSEGQEIEPGQVLCIVEAMKLMNEIESEIRGTVLEILVENGTPVEYGDRLFKVRTKG